MGGGGGHMKFYAYQKKGGGEVDKVLAMKGGGEAQKVLI